MYNQDLDKGLSNRKYKDFLKGFGLYAIMGIGAIIIFFPFIWTLLTSLKTMPEIQRIPLSLLPDHFYLKNYVEVFNRVPFGRYLYNSIFTSLISIAATLVVSSLAGYGFAKFKFPLKETFFFGIIGLLIIPFQAIVIPLYMMAVSMGLANTYAGLLLPSLVSAFGIFMMREAITIIPNDYLDSGRIDGCSELRIFWNIIIPMVKPSLATLAIIKFLWTWNEFFWPFIITSTEEMKVVTIGLTSFTNQYFTEYHLMTASAMISVLPLVIAFLFLQKWIVKGIAMSGLKG
jgi:multiple sugar transport system permease protein